MSMSTKDRIIEVSIDLFSKKGYAETSIRDIAKEAGIKTSSIYYYFESKEAILDNILSLYMEIVNYDKHHYKWNEEKKTIIDGGSKISIKKIMSYLFFKFDHEHADKYTKMLKIICSESVRNDTVRDYERKIVDSGYRYIKSVLDVLLEAGAIKKCDTTKLATVLYSIAFAYMHLNSIDMNYIGIENDDIDMFTPLEYVFEILLSGSSE